MRVGRSEFRISGTPGFWEWDCSLPPEGWEPRVGIVWEQPGEAGWTQGFLPYEGP